MTLDDKRVLIIDDDLIVRDFLTDVTRSKGCRVDSIGDSRLAVDRIKKEKYDLVLTDMNMPHITGMDILETVKDVSPSTDVVVITGYGSIEDAVEVMKRGAVDYLTKPCPLVEIELLIDRVFAIQMLPKEEPSKPTKIPQFAEMVGQSEKMQRIFEAIRLAAPSKATILVQGETGTGKELVARAIHRLSSRHDKPFVSINCATMPEGLVESELFGHEKGAFTGAIARRKGRFEIAHRGTLLLDEVSEVPLPIQAKLLRVIQEGEFERVGSTTPLKTDVRLVATTNRVLEEEVQKRRFREDLFYRLNVIPMKLAPLSERPEDIPLLVEHFLEKYNRGGGLSKKMSPEALELLQQFDWPGNIRQLENVIERAVVMSRGEVLQCEHLQLEMPRTTSTAALEESSSFSGLTLWEAEMRLILDTLKAQGGNRTKTTQVLGISVRTLRNKLSEYRGKGISID